MLDLLMWEDFYKVECSAELDLNISLELSVPLARKERKIKLESNYYYIVDSNKQGR